MKRLWNMAIGLCAAGVVVLAGGYVLDHHRCKGINYEQAAYELPTTVFISAKQCLAAANAVKLRSYARNL
jgi:hypothetical protein